MRLRVASINDRPIKPTDLRPLDRRRDDHLDEDKADFGIVTATDAAGSGLKIVMPLAGDLCPSIDDVAAETADPQGDPSEFLDFLESDEARAIFQIGRASARKPGRGRKMTAPLARTRTILGHPLTVRVTHWINAIAILIMIGSGWRIWNSSPIFDFHFPVDITLGGDVELSQDVHNETGLAGALEWHFAAMWLLVVNGLVYFLYGIVCGHLRRTMFPVGPSAFVRDAWAALQFRLPHRPGCVQRRAEGPLYSWRQELESPGMIFAGWSASLEPPWAPRLGA